LVLTRKLSSSINNQEKDTVDALNALKKVATDKLKKLEYVQWLFGSEIPLDCEKLAKPAVVQKIRERLDNFEYTNKLDELYNGLGLGSSSVSSSASPRKSPKELKVEIIDFLKSEEMTELCKLAKLDIVGNNVDKLETIAKQDNFKGLYDEDNKLKPQSDPALWKKLLVQLKNKYGWSKADVEKLIPFLDGTTALKALRKASQYDPDEDPKSLVNTAKLDKTKWLVDFLKTYKLSGFPIQIALDFYSRDIDDSFVKNISNKEAATKVAKDFTFLNGKDFVRSMVINSSFPTDFELESEFAGEELKQKLEEGYYIGQKLYFLNDNSSVFISKEITDEVERFE
jgi:hypothetical protein